MKITKKQLKQLIKEELEEMQLSERPRRRRASATADSTQARQRAWRAMQVAAESALEDIERAIDAYGGIDPEGAAELKQALGEEPLAVWQSSLYG